MEDAGHVIDVERLVDELKERVARGRAGGAYADDDPALRPGAPMALEPIGGASPLPTVAALPSTGAAPVPAPRVVYLPGTRYASPRRLSGAVVGFLRRLVLRLIHPALDDITRQADAAVVSLHARLEWAEAAIPAEVRAREGAAFLAEHVERRANDVAAAQRALEEATQEALDEAHAVLQSQRSELLRRLEDGLAELERLRERHEELRERQEEARARDEALAEEQSDVKLRHGERLDRLETTTRAQTVAGADTIRGLAEHLRELDVRARALEEELRAVARDLDGVGGAPVDAPAATRYADA